MTVLSASKNISGANENGIRKLIISIYGNNIAKSVKLYIGIRLERRVVYQYSSEILLFILHWTCLRPIHTRESRVENSLHIH
jgi:hypothetical protein